MNTVACRVHILLARQSQVAVAIRRGPSNRVCTVGWDRRTDEFRVGQWIKGRIFERRSDLSPDGRHLIYFAANGKWQSPSRGSWTAISKTPFLKALGLWANGSSWNGGGLFTTNRTYWLNVFPFGPFGHEERLKPVGLERDERPPFREGYGSECPGVYYIRLQYDGWRLLASTRVGSDGQTVFEKSALHGWVLEKTAHETSHPPPGKGCYFDTHRLIRGGGSKVLDLPDWEWADIDGKRLVWVTAGVLHAAQLTTEGLERETVLFDFNPLTFEELRAPYCGFRPS